VECNEKGISVIVCSIKPELCDQMLESVKNTIGINFETIIFDNREKGYGICQVYNHCAQKAIFPYLCFVHEDIIIPTQDWGKNMVAFAERTQNCGIIGFAGGTIAKKNFRRWERGRNRFYDLAGSRTPTGEFRLKYSNPGNKEFAEVVTLDGLFMFASREIWKNNPFDEDRIKGFHFYDADFSLGIAQKYQNYVCMTADIYHFSAGKPDKAFYENAMVFQKKWKKELPVIIGEQKITFMEEIDSATVLLVHSIQHGIGIRHSIKHLLEINGLGFSIFLLVSGFIRKIHNIFVFKILKINKRNI
jgi:hypothetical protein